MIVAIESKISTQADSVALGQSKTEAEAFTQVVDLDKRLENLFSRGFADAWTSVLHNKTESSIGLYDFKRYILPIRVFGSII